MLLLGGGWYQINTEDQNKEGDDWGWYIGFGFDKLFRYGTLTIDPVIIHITNLGTKHVEVWKTGFTVNLF